MPTKAQIDALVEAIPYHPDAGFLAFGNALYVSKADVREALFLAAGLNADGSEKAKGVRAWLVENAMGKRLHLIKPALGAADTITSGVFTPDPEGR